MPRPIGDLWGRTVDFARINLKDLSGVVNLRIIKLITYPKVLTIVRLCSLASYTCLAVTRSPRRLTFDLSLPASLALVARLSAVLEIANVAQGMLTASEIRFLPEASPSLSFSLFGIAAINGFDEHKKGST